VRPSRWHRLRRYTPRGSLQPISLSSCRPCETARGTGTPERSPRLECSSFARPVIGESLPVGINDHLHDVAHVADFVRRAQPHLRKRVVSGAVAVGGCRREPEAELPHALSRASRERPVLALEVVNQNRVRPHEQCGRHDADALAAARRREDQHVRRPAIADEGAAPSAEIDASASRLRTYQAQTCGDVMDINRPASRSAALP